MVLCLFVNMQILFKEIKGNNSKVKVKAKEKKMIYYIDDLNFVLVSEQEDCRLLTAIISV